MAITESDIFRQAKLAAAHEPFFFLLASRDYHVHKSPQLSDNTGPIHQAKPHRTTQGPEVRYKWNSIHQYRPVSLQAAREIWRARPMSAAIHALLKRDRRIRFAYVRTEGKLLASLLRGWAMIMT